MYSKDRAIVLEVVALGFWGWPRRVGGLNSTYRGFNSTVLTRARSVTVAFT
jgi:hypothetical protein